MASLPLSFILDTPPLRAAFDGSSKTRVGEHLARGNDPDDLDARSRPIAPRAARDGLVVHLRMGDEADFSDPCLAPGYRAGRSARTTASASSTKQFDDIGLHGPQIDQAVVQVGKATGQPARAQRVIAPMKRIGGILQRDDRPARRSGRPDAWWPPSILAARPRLRHEGLIASQDRARPERPGPCTARTTRKSACRHRRSKGTSR